MRSRRSVLSAAMLGCFEDQVATGCARGVPFALPPALLRRISFSYAGTLDEAASVFAGRIGYACIPLRAPTLLDTWPIEVSVEVLDVPAHEVWRQINSQVTGRTLVIHPDTCTVEVCCQVDPHSSRLPRAMPLRTLLAVVTVLGGIAAAAPSQASGKVRDMALPPAPPARAVR